MKTPTAWKEMSKKVGHEIDEAGGGGTGQGGAGGQVGGLGAGWFRRRSTPTRTESIDSFRRLYC